MINLITSLEIWEMWKAYVQVNHESLLQQQIARVGSGLNCWAIKLRPAMYRLTIKVQYNYMLAPSGRKSKQNMSQSLPSNVMHWTLSVHCAVSVSSLSTLNRGWQHFLAVLCRYHPPQMHHIHKCGRGGSEHHALGIFSEVHARQLGFNHQAKIQPTKRRDMSCQLQTTKCATAITIQVQNCCP